MFLQVMTLSKITNHTGTEILPHILTNHMHPNLHGLGSISFSTLQWPHIHPPSMACWRLWSLAICSVYAGSTKNTHITMPLGAWLPIHATTHFWNWHLLDVNHLMYQASANAKTCIALSTLHRRTLMKFSPTIPSTLEFSGPPITPLDPTTGYTRLSVAPIDFPVPATATTLMQTMLQHQFRQQIPAWQHTLFASLHKAYWTMTLYSHLSAGIPIILISDASVQRNSQSRFAWVIAYELTPLWHGLGLAPGPIEDMHSGCVKAFGLFATLTFFAYYLSCFDHPVPELTIQCFCDNLGVITTLTEMQTNTITQPNDTLNNDRDILLAITAVATSCLPVSLQYNHVKGHQDTQANLQ